mgnify:CR=1 FL=1
MRTTSSNCMSRPSIAAFTTSRAEDAYRQAVALRGDNADTHLQLGHALKMQGKRSEAIASYRRSCMLDPASPHAANELRDMGAPVPSEEEIAEFEAFVDALPPEPDAPAEGGGMGRNFLEFSGGGYGVP